MAGDRREPTEEAAQDSELMHRVRAGDTAAFAELMERWELPVKRLIARILLNASEAEDLAQETLVRVWQQREKFNEGAAVRPWIFTIAANLARNRLRWWRRRPSVSLDAWSERSDEGLVMSDECAGAQGMERAERAVAVRDAVAALPAELREALVLSEYEGLSHAEIATVAGCSTKGGRIAGGASARKTARGAASLGVTRRVGNYFVGADSG